VYQLGPAIKAPSETSRSKIANSWPYILTLCETATLELQDYKLSRESDRRSLVISRVELGPSLENPLCTEYIMRKRTSSPWVGSQTRCSKALPAHSIEISLPSLAQTVKTNGGTLRLQSCQRPPGKNELVLATFPKATYAPFATFKNLGRSVVGFKKPGIIGSNLEVKQVFPIVPTIKGSLLSSNLLRHLLPTNPVSSNLPKPGGSIFCLAFRTHAKSRKSEVNSPRVVPPRKFGRVSSNSMKRSPLWLNITMQCSSMENGDYPPPGGECYRESPSSH